ncbi:hypothetical protein DL98DRAFT_19605 [Cadophora sp. DSE1049]|nr:hypothetical protein DL98DRAFT_19605 [Cadophora sp. DSE1049]
MSLPVPYSNVQSWRVLPSMPMAYLTILRFLSHAMMRLPYINPSLQPTHVCQEYVRGPQVGSRGGIRRGYRSVSVFMRYRRAMKRH